MKEEKRDLIWMENIQDGWWRGRRVDNWALVHLPNENITPMMKATQKIMKKIFDIPDDQFVSFDELYDMWPHRRSLSEEEIQKLREKVFGKIKAKAMRQQKIFGENKIEDDDIPF